MAQQPPPPNGTSQPQYTYTPPPPQLPYYNALFTIADKSSVGYLSGPQAVEFLSTSKLPIELLKQIWTMADQPQTNTLDTSKFHVAVRLIQLFQNGKKPIDLSLNVGDVNEEGSMRPPFFEGVNVQAVMQQAQQQQQQQPQQNQPTPQLQQQPTQQQPSSPQRSPQSSPQMGPSSSASVMMNGGSGPQQSSSQTVLTVQDPYTMTPQELSRYETLFPSYAVVDENDGKLYVNGGTAVELFSKSGMDRESLKAIWGMSDDPIDNKLDSIEFSIAMHLIVCVTKKGLAMPPSLPPSLGAIVREARGQQQQQQQQQQGMGMGSGQSVIGAPPATQGGIPSPDKQPGMMMQQQQQQLQQQPQMNGGMTHQMGMVQPQMGGQQLGGVPGGGSIQQTGSFGAPGPVGGETVDDAFAGLSNDPVESVDEYSAIGAVGTEGDSGMSATAGFGGQAAMSTMGGVQPEVHQQHQMQPVHTLQEVATPEPSPQPVAPAIQAQAVMPAPPMQQLQQTNNALPPRSPRVPPKSPRSAHARGASEDSTAELNSLRDAHQKLQAEVISLRAKAASVSDEEQETQKEISQLASEIGKLSMELSELKETVMDAKVKLSESVGILKVQLEKKGSLESQVEDARTTHEALISANAAVEEANELAMAQQARSVAANAVAKEEASVVPPVDIPQPTETENQPTETADLFSWGAPVAPTPVAPVHETMPSFGSDAPSVQHDSSSVAQESTQLPAPAPWGSSDATSVVSHSVQGGGSVAPSVYSSDAPLGNSNPNPYGIAPSSGPSLDFMGAPMGGAPMQQQEQQPAMSPMMGGVGIPEPTMGFDYQQQSVAPAAALTPPRGSFASYESAPAPQPQPTGPPSPTKAELEAVKAETDKAESQFRSCTDLVRSISTEVVKLESAAQKAEADMSTLEGKTKKGSFVGGKKKKAKKEYEKAMEAAQAERKKVQDAKEQLAAAEREAENAKSNVENLRQKYESMEMDAATAASYISAQQSHNDQQSIASGMTGYAQPAANQYSDPFGGMSSGQTAPASDPYGMGLMGGAPPSQNSDYANPFL